MKLKKIFILVIVGLLLLCCFEPVDASPIYLTIEGQVDSFLGDCGVNTGDTITQIWMYDTSVQGYEGTYGDNWFDPFDEVNKHGRFYAERLTMGVIEPYYFFEDNVDYGGSGPGYEGTVFYTGSYYNPTVHTKLWFRGLDIDQLIVGAQVFTNEHSYWGGPDEGDMYVHWIGRIVNVSTSNPVPEPSTILLLSSGLLGLVAIKSRKKKS